MINSILIEMILILNKIYLFLDFKILKYKNFLSNKKDLEIILINKN